MKQRVRSDFLHNQSEPPIPIDLWKDGDKLTLTIDGVTWTETENPMHAAVMFEMFMEHLTEYMTYTKK